MTKAKAKKWKANLPSNVPERMKLKQVYVDVCYGFAGETERKFLTAETDGSINFELPEAVKQFPGENMDGEVFIVEALYENTTKTRNSSYSLIATER